MRFFQGCCIGGCLSIILWIGLVLLVIAMVGCGGGGITSSSPVRTAAQEEAISSSYRYASIKGLHLDDVVITNDLPNDNYAAWAVCGKPVIAFNAEYIERPEAFNRIHQMAAHEVCHIYYKDNMPCGRDLDSAKVEKRAEACAAEMYGG
jgi:hypothetical protein